MSWWKVLDIPYDSDLKTIKRSYAKLLKIYNPEDEPECYQRLREAYDTAVKYVKNNKQSDLPFDLLDTHDEVNLLETETSVEEKIINSQYENLEISSGEENLINLRMEEFFNRLNEIYNDESLRNDIDTWEELLNCDVVWNVYSSPIIEDYIFEFLMSREDLLPNILYILNHHFNWIDKERILCNKYDEKTVENIFRTIRNINQLEYEHIKKINPNFIEKYLSLCNKGYIALDNKDYYDAQIYLLDAYEIFSEDKNLLIALGDFYYGITNIEISLKFYKSAFELDKSNLELSLYIGKILGSIERFEESSIYTELYLCSNSNDLSALNNLAYNYYYSGNLLKAKEVLEKLIQIKPNKRAYKKYLKNTVARLNGKNIKPIKLKKNKQTKKLDFNNKSETSTIKRVIKFILCFAIFVVVSFALYYIFTDTNITSKKGF